MYKRNKSQQPIYPQDIQCVIDSINGQGAVFIGNLQASENLRTLMKNNIGAVLTAAKSIRLNHPKSHVPYHLHIPGQDHQRFDLSKYFDQAIHFIQTSRQKTNILIHCMAGVSRSVTLLLAYLIKNKGMSYNQAYNAIKKRRRIINPNRGFIKQLQKFQRQVNSLNANKRKSVNPQIQNNQYQRYAKSLGRKNYEPSSNLSLDRDTHYNQQAQKYAEQIWPSNNNNNNTLFSSNYYNTLLQRKKHQNYNTNNIKIENFTKNYQNIEYPSNKTDQNKKEGNQSIKISQFYNYKRKRQAEKSFQELNRDLDQRISDIRQKYSDLASHVNRGNDRIKDINIDDFYPINNPIERVRKQNITLNPSTHLRQSSLLNQKDKYSSHQSIRASLYFDNKPYKLDYYHPIYGKLMSSPRHNNRHGYDKFTSMRASYYNY